MQPTSDRRAVWQFLLHNLSDSTQPVFVTHTTCSTTHRDGSVQQKAFLGHFSHLQQMALTVSPGPVATDIWVHLQASPCGICGGQSGTGPGFSLSVLIFPCQCYSTNAPHPFIHLTLILYVLSNCQCRYMKHRRKMYKMRFKNLRT